MKNAKPWSCFEKAGFGFAMFMLGICAHHFYVNRGVLPEIGFRTHFTTEVEDALIDEVVAKMPTQVVDSVKMVVRVSDVWDGIAARHIQDKAVKGVILIGDYADAGPEEYRVWFSRIIRHEFTHSFASNLPEEAWEELANIIPPSSYVGHDYPKLHKLDFPSDGFAQPYARKDLDEYVGVLGEEMFTFLSG